MIGTRSVLAAASGAKRRNWWKLLVLAASFCLIATPPTMAQMRLVLPPDDYFRAFPAYLSGDYATARRYFARGYGRRTSSGESVDSIPAHTMVGECLYHMGDLRGALEQYNIALRLFLKSPYWLTKIDLPQTLGPATKALHRPPTWTGGTRAVKIARIPDPLPVLEGNTPNQNMRTLQRGGVLAAQQFVLVHCKEIVRCTALAIRRRNEILGPAAKYDEFTNQLITVLESRPAPNRSWTQAWVSCQLGLAYIGAGKYKEALAQLNSSLLVGGMDHVLTPTALLELGRLALRAQQYAQAERLFLDASLSAAILVQQDTSNYGYDLIGEALRQGMLAHRAAGSQKPFAPLLPAAAWSHRESYALEATLLITAAEDFAARRNASQAGTVLERAARVLRRREMVRGRYGARYQYVLAHVSFLHGDASSGRAALAKAMTFARTGAKWPFQIALVDHLYVSGALETHRAGPLYATVLRDPTAQDWQYDPMESLAALTAPNLSAYQHWLKLLLDRKELDEVLRVSDQLRRRRFYGTLPLGGRLVNLRWIVAAPLEAMPDRAAPLRQSLFAHYPELAAMTQQVNALRTQLGTLPHKDPTPEQIKQQTSLLKQLGKICAAQEALLSAIALGPEPSETVFPPPMDLQAIQKRLAPGQGIMSFLTLPGGTYAFMVDKSNYQPWQLKSPAKIRTNIGKLLREMGLYERNQLLTVEALGQEEWKNTAAELLNDLTGNAAPDVWDHFQELTIVPEGPLWYVPFAALQVGTDGERQPLINKVSIRYAPLLALAVPDRRPRKRIADTAIVAGRMFPQKDNSLALDMLRQMQKDDPNVFAVPTNPVPPSALYATTLDRLIVMSDIPAESAGPYAWAPMALDRGKAIGTLASWLELPWGKPDQILLPGFHTGAENGLQKGGNGDELFFAACGLMATGTRTVLLSRWQEGGTATCDLVREFVRELPNRSASAAWQRAVHLVMANDLIFAEEPRIKTPTEDVALKTDHPFFWANCIVIDRGVQPKK